MWITYYNFERYQFQTVRVLLKDVLAYQKKKDIVLKELVKNSYNKNHVAIQTYWANRSRCENGISWQIRYSISQTRQISKVNSIRIRGVVLDMINWD